MKKKGISFSGWIEGILLVVLLIALVGGVVGDFNVEYNKDHQLGIGTNTTEAALINYAQSSSDEIKGGEVELTAEGFSLKSAWGVIKSMISIIWDFISGGIIIKLVNYMKLDAKVGIIFQSLYLISVTLIILSVVFRRSKT